MKYVMLQLKDRSIVIIDNSTSIGMARVNELLRDDADPVGTIESNLTPTRLMLGLNKVKSDELGQANEKLMNVQKVLNIEHSVVREVSEPWTAEEIMKREG